jgi:tryptophan-rich sensory protein
MAGRKIFLLVIALGICLLAGYIGAYYTTPEIPTWYESLQKPDLTPPLMGFWASMDNTVYLHGHLALLDP